MGMVTHTRLQGAIHLLQRMSKRQRRSRVSGLARILKPMSTLLTFTNGKNRLANRKLSKNGRNLKAWHPPNNFRY